MDAAVVHDEVADAEHRHPRAHGDHERARQGALAFDTDGDQRDGERRMPQREQIIELEPAAGRPLLARFLGVVDVMTTMAPQQRSVPNAGVDHHGPGLHQRGDRDEHAPPLSTSALSEGAGRDDDGLKPVVAPSWPRRGPFVDRSWPSCGPVVAPSWTGRGPVVAPSWTWPWSPESRTQFMRWVRRNGSASRTCWMLLFGR